MRENQLRTLFRHVLLASIAAPVVACGGQIVTEAGDSGGETSADTATGDTAVPDTKPVDTGTCTPIKRSSSVCDTIVDYPCGIPDGFDAGLTPDQCKAICPPTSGPGSFFSCWFEVPDGGPAAALHCTSCAVGRRPEGFALDGSRSDGSAGDWFARVAELEAASIDAFRVLRTELRAHGAPKRLQNMARRAQADEVRHARAMGTIAHRHGGRFEKPIIGKRHVRSLEALAVDNAVEGCVRETFGALVATLQARRSKDPRVKAAMRRIARDETRHAALSWQLARWLDSKLDAAARARVLEARSAAVRTLYRELRVEPSRELQQVAGLPSADEALRMADLVAHDLWRAAA